MATLFDDKPHPVPPYAYLRWKENYFFIIMDEKNGVFGISHINNEPLFNRSRFTLNLNIRGERFEYASEIPFPENFALADELTDGSFSLRFVENQKRFDLSLHNDDLTVDLVFLARRPVFDFAACRYSAPDAVSFQEIMTCGMNLPFNHQQQSLTVSGTIAIKGKKKAHRIDGLGYRDHSWVMRADTLVRNHFWTGLNFPGRAFGVKAIEVMSRPGVWAKEGYVSDDDGDRALTSIDVIPLGQRDGWPEVVQFELRDALGKKFHIHADVAGRHSDVQLVSEKASAENTYRIIETFCPLRLLEYGEEGSGLVEIGKHPSLFGQD
ncbi:MAG: hypothetical protein WC997_01320 [Porticoccaceae bacterium]